jgi:hypothetical protein
MFPDSFSLVKLQTTSTIRITYPDQIKDPARCSSWLGRSAQCRIVEQSSVEFNSRVADDVHRRSKVVLTACWLLYTQSRERERV